MATQLEVSRLLGISDRWLQKLAEQGVITRRGRGEWDALEAAKELLAYRASENERLKAEVASLHAQRAAAEGSSASKSDEDARLAKARADKAEMEVAEMRGELVRVDRIFEPLNALVVNIKTRILAEPARLAPLVFGATSASAIEKMIRDNLEEALADLGKIKFIAKASDPDI